MQKQVFHFIDDNMDKYGRICYSVDLHRSVLCTKWAGHSDEVLSLTGIEQTPQFITCSKDKLIKIWNWEGQNLGIINISKPSGSFWKFQYDWIMVRLHEFQEVFNQLESIEGRTYEKNTRELITNNFFVKNYVVPYTMHVETQEKENRRNEFNKFKTKDVHKPNFQKYKKKSEETGGEKTTGNPNLFSLDSHYQNLLQPDEVTYIPKTKYGHELSSKIDDIDYQYDHKSNPAVTTDTYVGAIGRITGDLWQKPGLDQRGSVTYTTGFAGRSILNNSSNKGGYNSRHVRRESVKKGPLDNAPELKLGKLPSVGSVTARFVNAAPGYKEEFKSPQFMNSRTMRMNQSHTK